MITKLSKVIIVYNKAIDIENDSIVYDISSRHNKIQIKCV